MARTDASTVGGIIEVDSDIVLTPFIAIANELVTEHCTDSDYTDDRLAYIETWLAAHFYKLRDLAIASEKAGSVAVKYQNKIGLHLNQTIQGQTALILDGAGNLAALSKRMEEGEPASIGFWWSGENYNTAVEGD